MSTDTLEELYNNGCELKKDLLDDKDMDKALAELELFEARKKKIK